MTCSYCTDPAKHCIQLPVGERPTNPKVERGQGDHRKVEPVRFCAFHWAAFTTYLNLTLRTQQRP